ncbi:MAG: leucine-rich repeat protein [Clostridia bacterium]|nr:leucine-rich repeat protein [Clostridia bacterium]
MKKIAKITSLLLAVIFMFSGLAVSAFAAGEDLLTINVYDGFAVVTACRQNASGVIDIPSSYNGVAVTQIADGAFSDCNGITQINIPDSIKKVGKSAFDGCVGLKKIGFDGDECTIGASAFAHCSAMTDIVLPSALKTIPENAFYDCKSLSEIDIPDTVETIDKEAFRICTGIKVFDIPASVTYIGKNAFIGCTGTMAFTVASGNTVYSSADGVLYGPHSSSVSDKTLIQYPVGKADTSYNVQADTLVIGDSAFGTSEKLVSIVLPDGLKKIDSYAFNECKALKTVNIPSGVTKIGSLAFGKCAALESIEIPASVTDFGSAFYMSGLKNVTIADGVKTVSAKAFEGCVSLESVSIPESVTKIDFGAFYGCEKLGDVEIPASVNTIGTNAFANCAKIKLIVVEDSYAHTYAESNSIPYEIKGDAPPVTEPSTKPSTEPSTQPPTKPSTQPTTKKTVVSVSVEKLPAKTNYLYKEAIDTTGIELEVVYSDGSREIVKSGYSVSPLTFTERGTQTVTVEYEGKTAEFDVTVSFAWWQWIIWILALGFLWY